MLIGGCYCGQVRYEAEGPAFQETSCHCSICRRASGAAFVSWFSVPRSGFRFTQGTVERFASSEKAQRTFCPRCGTPLTFEHVDFGAELDVTTCSLDHPELLPPKDHTWTRNKLHWVVLADGLPQFPEDRAPDAK